jgi:hypothetical protein
MSAAATVAVTNKGTSKAKRTPAKGVTIKVKKTTIAANEAILNQLKEHAADDSSGEFKRIVAESGIDLWIRGSAKTPPMIYRLLGAEAFVSTTKAGLVIKTNPVSESISEYLMEIYYSKFPLTEFLYVKNSERKPMLTQKGMTCVSDAFYTILFESEVLKPHMEEFKKMLPRESSLGLSSGLCAAVDRYERINFTQRERRLSIENNLWEKGAEAFGDPGKGIVLAGMRSVFWNLFEENMYGIPGLEEGHFKTERLPSKISTKDTKTPADQYERFKNCFAFLVGFESMHPDPSERNRHVIGFIKNGGKWFILDNEVGFIHPVQDNEWFINVCMPRLDYSVNHFNSTVGANYRFRSINALEDRVLLYSRPAIDDLAYDFITLGAKCYPNEFERNLLFTLDARKRLRTPYQLIYIGENVGRGAGAVGGGARGRRTLKARR